MPRGSQLRGILMHTNLTPYRYENMNTILKSSNCPKLRGNTTLKYQIGLTPESKIAIRVTENNRFSGGSFCDKWLLLSDIEAALGRGVFASKGLSPIIQGDNNNKGFVMAVLLHEGLVKRSKRRPQRFEWSGKAKFIERMKVLLAAKLPIPDIKKQVA